MIDLVSAAAIAAVGVFTILVAMAGVSVGLSWYHLRRDHRRHRRRDALREALFDRLDRDDPALDVWVADRSPEERDLLSELALTYLRSIEGSDREPFLELAWALWLGETALEAYQQDERLHQIRGLSTLALTDHPLDDLDLPAPDDDPRIRECAARLLHERRDEIDDASRRATALLVGDGSEPLSIYGLETLATVNASGATPLLNLAEAAAATWTTDLVIQVCRVLEHTDQVDVDAPIAWLYPYLTADSPTLRAAAIRAFKPHGWRDDVRDHIDLQRLLADEDPQVRTAAYETLAYWGDASAREHLTWAIIDEDHPRAQLRAIRGLLSIGADPVEDSPGWPAEAWAWIDAELEVSDRRALAHSRRQEVGP